MTRSSATPLAFKAALTSLGGAVRAFLDPVLAGASGVWEPTAGR